jgi:hypothetical protein
MARDDSELALGEAMTALQLGNCDLVRLRGTSDGGVAARLCGPAELRDVRVSLGRTWRLIACAKQKHKHCEEYSNIPIRPSGRNDPNPRFWPWRLTVTETEKP